MKLKTVDGFVFRKRLTKNVKAEKTRQSDALGHTFAVDYADHPPLRMDDMDDQAKGCEEIPAQEGIGGTNTGHGHVWPRPDGTVARCGGPGMCEACSRDKARADAARVKDAIQSLTQGEQT